MKEVTHNQMRLNAAYSQDGIGKHLPDTFPIQDGQR
jgi:hypothetical protein